MNSKTAVVLAALGFTPAPESDADRAPAVPSFDGGARQSPPVAESHGDWLLRVIRGEPDVSSGWPWPHG